MKVTVLKSSTGFNVTPDQYIQGYNYDMVQKHLNDNNKIKIYWAQRGRKSTCLVAYWHKYIKNDKEVVLIGVNTIKKFYEDHTIQDYLQSFKDFATSECKDESSLKLALSAYITKEDPIVLLDLALMNAYEDDVLCLVKICNKTSCCLVAMSSGSGSHFSRTDKEEKLANALLRFVSIEFIPFTKAEAVLFVRLKGVQLPLSCEEHEEKTLIRNSV